MAQVPSGMTLWNIPISPTKCETQADTHHSGSSVDVKPVDAKPKKKASVKRAKKAENSEEVERIRANLETKI